eukprot:m.360168 g.360168  ORF g.360168 m.360168 type:complete len:488 (+) comp18909_c0_seq1:45-1508(+)
MLTACLVALVALVGVQSVSAATSLPWIKASKTSAYLYDDTNRIRLFHGVNYIQKGFPWYPAPLLNKTEIQVMQDNGINVIRLGMMWSGAEPEENNFNETYFQIIETIIENLAEHNIYTLFDMHQDGLSSKFCLYDGVPLWVINRSEPRRAFPWPLPGNCSRPWAENELAEASGQAYSDLYHNTRGMRDAYVNFWQVVAKRFANNSNVIGYELINEPFAGDVYQDPTLFLPGVAGNKSLSVLYDAVAPAIRAVDSKHLIFYEPVTWGMIFNNQVMGSGFTHVPGGAQNIELSVFAFHYYCWLYDFGTPSTFKRQGCDNGLGKQVFEAVEKDIAQVGGSSFLTEFGATTCDPDSGNATECQYVLDLCDQHYVSWTHWPGNNDYTGSDYIWPDYSKLGFSRPYMTAAAGEQPTQSFNTTTNEFHACWQVTTDLMSQKSVLFMGTNNFYPSGPAIEQTSNLIVEISKDTNMLYATATTTGNACVTLTVAQE